MSSKEDEKTVTRSSGNVYADLGIPNPELMKLKGGLVRQIRQIIKKRKLTQRRAGELMGIDQPKVSALIRGKFSGYSLDRLFGFLARLNAHINVEVSVKSWPEEKKPAPKSRPQIRGKFHLNPLVIPESDTPRRKHA